MNEVTIRPGTRDDVPRVFELVQELAEYENAGHEVATTPEQLARDGFGEQPLFGLLVAETNAEIVGISLYYFRYSTWKGKRLWLEDLIVTQSARGQGVGRALLEATIEAAREHNCTGLMWQVLEWNEPAITFYEKFGARLDAEWSNVHLELKTS